MRSCYEAPLSIHGDASSSVVVFEEGTVPFPVRRTFLVKANEGEIRGAHAHRGCSQFPVVIRGEILVTVFDGSVSRKFLLNDLAQGLVIPPLNWATQKYLRNDSTLLVVCDQVFDEADYIRDLEEFRRLI